MDPLGWILLAVCAVILGNLVVAIACLIISRTGDPPGPLRVLAGLLLLLDIPPILMVVPGMFGPSPDEILGMGEGWRLLAITIFLLFLLPGLFLLWAAFKRRPHLQARPP
jgi:hypothetical protein